MNRILTYILIFFLVLTYAKAGKINIPNISDVYPINAKYFSHKADSLIKEKMYKQAIVNYNLAISYSKDTVFLFDVSIRKLECLLLLKQFDQLIKEVDSVSSLNIDRLEKSGEFEGIASLHTKKADALNLKGMYSKASAIYRGVLVYRDKLDITTLRKIYDRIGLNYYQSSQYDSALWYFDKSVENANYSIAYAERLDLIGIIYAKKGLYAKSDSLFSKSLLIKLDSMEGDDLSLGYSYNILGLVNKKKGNYDQAIDYLKQSLQIRRNKLGENSRLTADTYNNLGLVYKDLGINNLALEYLSNALRMRKTVFGERHPEVAGVYNNIGLIHYATGDYSKAIKNFQIALEIKYQFLGEEHQSTAHSIHNIGMVYTNENLLDSALLFVKRALDTRLKLFGEIHPDVSDSYSLLGQIHAKNKDYGQSFADYAKSLDIRQQIHGNKHYRIAQVFNEMGFIYSQKEDYTNAISCYDKAIASNALSQSGSSILLETPTFHNVQVGISSLVGKAEVYQAQFKTNKKISFLEMSIKCYQYVDKLAQEYSMYLTNLNDKFEINAKMLSIYEELIKLNLQLYLIDPKEVYKQNAFIFSERTKATVLNQTLADLNAKKIIGIPDSLLEEENRIKSEINYCELQLKEAMISKSSIPDTKEVSNYENQLFNIKQEYQQFVKLLEMKYQGYYSLKYKSTFTDVTLIQRKIGVNSALIEFFEGENRYYIFLITKEDFHVFDFPRIGIDEGIAAIRIFLNGKQNYSPEVLFKLFTENGYSTYEQLLKQPLKKLPDQVNELIVIPAGKLSYIPLELLPQSSLGFDSFDYKNIDYLINNYIISYGYSATMTFTESATSLNSNRNQGKFIGFAPSYPNSSNDTTSSLVALGKFRDAVTPLEWNTKEVENISSQLHGDYSISEDATEGYFKSTANDYGIIHLAMHALIDDEDPLNSKLVFTNSEIDSLEDGFLHVYELFNMHLSSEMVVLSACNTGYGKLARGEGLMSLGYGFTYAGCPSMVVSGWQVDDQYTSELMQLFYSHLKKGEKKNIALRNAKLDFLQTTNHVNANPFYWGGFMLVGNTESITFDNDIPNIWIVFGLSVIGLIATYLFIKNKRKAIE